MADLYEDEWDIIEDTCDFYRKMIFPDIVFFMGVLSLSSMFTKIKTHRVSIFARNVLMVI